MSKIITRKTILFSNEDLGYFAWPTVTRLPNGNIAVFCSGFRYRHVCPFGKVVMIESSDEGITWNEPKIILNTPLDDRDAGVLVDGNRVFITTFNNSKAFQLKWQERFYDEYEKQFTKDAVNAVTTQDEEKYLGSLVFYSDDNCKTFSQPFKVPLSSPHGFIKLSNNKYFYLGTKYGAEDGNLYYSLSDDGLNWNNPVMISLPEWKSRYLFTEPHAVERSDGKILLITRIERPGVYMMMKCTLDLATNIQTPFEPMFNGAPPHLLRRKNGEILLSYGYRHLPYGARVHVSRDDGDTFTDETIVCDDLASGDCGYASSVELKNGNILTAYYGQLVKNKKNTIQIAIWTPKGE